MQLQDDNIREIIEKVKAGNKEMCKEYLIKNGRLFRKVSENHLWVVPKALQWRVIQGQHDNAGHLGVEKTLTGLQKHFWFPRMRNAVKLHIKACVECAFNKSPGGRHEGKYHNDKITPVPFHTVHMDHLGPFPKSSKRNEHILVIVDAFTKFTLIKAVKSTASKHVISNLNEISEYFGVPTRIITDRGTAFTSHEFERY
ncbi:Pro-Pol polyprotein [Lucilia cuprina]|nr:Pro-Pol polyprotein [Lucilia cuprina]